MFLGSLLDVRLCEHIATSLPALRRAINSCNGYTCFAVLREQQWSQHSHALSLIDFWRMKRSCDVLTKIIHRTETCSPWWLENQCDLCTANLHSGVWLIPCKRTFVQSVDQTVLLSVDRVVVQHRARDTVERECAAEEEQAGSLTTTTADGTWHTRMMSGSFQADTKQSVSEPLRSWSHTRENVCVCKVRAVRCGVYTFSVQRNAKKSILPVPFVPTLARIFDALALLNMPLAMRLLVGLGIATRSVTKRSFKGFVLGKSPGATSPDGQGTETKGNFRIHYIVCSRCFPNSGQWSQTLSKVKPVSLSESACKLLTSDWASTPYGSAQCGSPNPPCFFVQCMVVCFDNACETSTRSKYVEKLQDTQHALTHTKHIHIH